MADKDQKKKAKSNQPKLSVKERMRLKAEKLAAKQAKKFSI